MSVVSRVDLNRSLCEGERSGRRTRRGNERGVATSGDVLSGVGLEVKREESDS